MQLFVSIRDRVSILMRDVDVGRAGGDARERADVDRAGGIARDKYRGAKNGTTKNGTNGRGGFVVGNLRPRSGAASALRLRRTSVVTGGNGLGWNRMGEGGMGWARSAEVGWELFVCSF